MADVTPTRQIDCRRMSCPLPIKQAEVVIDGMKKGEVLEIMGTDPNIKEELAAFAEERGHHFLGLSDDLEFTRYLIRV